MKPLTTMAVGAIVLALGYGAADAQNGRVRQDGQDVRQDPGSCTGTTAISARIAGSWRETARSSIRT
jgi:hypothetical protein